MSYRQLQRFELVADRGIDLSRAIPHRTRATLLKNLITRDNANQKRFGWRDVGVFQLDGGAVKSIEGEIKGIWDIKLRYYDDTDMVTIKDYILILAGLKLYYKDKTEDYYSLLHTYSSLKANSEFNLFTQDNNVYILGGGDYIRIYTTATEIKTESIYNNSYIPYVYMHGLADNSTKDITTKFFESPNLLSLSRKCSYWFSDTETITGDIEFTFKEKPFIETVDDIQVTVNDTELTNTLNGTKIEFYDDATKVGEVELGEPTKFTMVDTEIKTDLESDNILITYKIKEPTGRNKNVISNCSFGVVFGVEGRLNQLFVSGNPDFPNRDWHSAMNDFTYFPDINYKDLGSGQTRITGYQLLADNALAVFKETSATEPSLFIRTGKFEKLLSNDEFEQPIFSDVTSFVGEGSHAPQGSCFFNGEPIIISKSGVYAINASHNVASTERYTKERGYPINRMLVKERNLDQAKSIAYENKLYVAINNRVYVADSRYIYDELGNYEWWVWENMPVNCWAVVDGNLCFGTKGGNLCEMTVEFVDRKYYSSVFSPYVENGVVTGFTTSGIDDIIKDKDTVRFVKHNTILIADFNGTNADITLTRDGDKLIVSRANQHKPLPPVLFEDNLETYIYTNGTAQEITEKVLNHEDFYIIFTVNGSLDDTTELIYKGTVNGYIQIGESPKYTMTYDKTGDTQMYFKGSLFTLFVKKEEPIVAEWQSTPLDLGSKDYAKVLNYITITSSSQNLEWGYRTRKTDANAENIADKGFSFSDLDFAELDFTMFTTSYTKRIFTPPFNFMQLRYRHEAPSNCNVNSFIVGYKVTNQYIGVK